MLDKGVKMRTVLSRASNLGGFASSCLLWLIPLIAITSFYFSHGIQPEINLSVKDLQLKMASEDRFVRKATPIAYFTMSLTAGNEQ